MKLEILLLLTVFIVGVYGNARGTTKKYHWKDIPRENELIRSSPPKRTVFELSSCQDKVAICNYCRQLGPS